MASNTFIVLVLLSFSATAFSAADTTHFSYSFSARDWSGVCETGKRQSPINIVKRKAEDKGTSRYFGLKYDPSNFFTIKNGGHVIEVTPSNANDNKLIHRDGSVYKLLQFHFHGFSEHSMDGLFSPLEVHFVHQSEEDPEKFAVVGAFLRGDSDEADNEMLEDIVDNMPSTISSENVTGPSVKWSELLLGSSKKSDSYRVYNYLGSLTTPGCSELVEWFFLEKPQEISTNQAIKFYDAIAAVNRGVRMNNRPPQPLNDRKVKTFKARRKL